MMQNELPSNNPVCMFRYFLIYMFCFGDTILSFIKCSPKIMFLAILQMYLPFHFLKMIEFEKIKKNEVEISDTLTYTFKSS